MWKTRWRVEFRSTEEVDYAAEIMEQDWQGEVQKLKGGPDPFVTREDDEADIFKAVRGQSGYLTIVIDPNKSEEAGLIEQIPPKNDRERMVRLMRGTAVEWQGFLCCDIYTQPWEGSAYLMELPVQGMTATLESIEIGSKDTGIWRLARVLTHAMNRLIADDTSDPEGEVEKMMGSVFVADDTAQADGGWLHQYINWQAFFTEQSEIEQQRRSVRAFGWNWREILEEICKTFGLTIRERGNNLYFTACDRATHLRRWSWAQIKTIASGGTAAPTEAQMLTTGLTAGLQLKGADSRQSIAQGKKKATVILTMSDETLTMSPTEAESGGGEVYDVPNMDYTRKEHVYVQPVDIVNTDSEEYTYHWARWATPDPVELSQFVAIRNSILLDPNTDSGNPTYDLGRDRANAKVTGSFPVRYSHKNSETDSVVLRPGLWLQQQRMVEGAQTYPCYTLRSAISFSARGGYLSLDMTVENFWLGFLSGDRNKWHFGHPQRGDHNMILSLLCSLKIGAKQWVAGHTNAIGDRMEYERGQWKSTSGGTQMFWLIFDGDTLRSNKTEEMIVDSEGTYLIPLGNFVEGTGGEQGYYEDQDFYGTVELTIYDVQYLWSNLSSQSGGWVTSPARVVTNMDLRHIPKKELTASNLTENKYSKTTGIAFKGERTTELKIGTFFNNPDNACFLLKSAQLGDYLQQMTYDSGSERPEVHLLDRMVDFYRKPRHEMQAVVSRDIETHNMMYTHSGGTYIGLDARTRWRDEEKVVKYIEVADADSAAATAMTESQEHATEDTEKE